MMLIVMMSLSSYFYTFICAYINRVKEEALSTKYASQKHTHTHPHESGIRLDTQPQWIYTHTHTVLSTPSTGAPKKECLVVVIFAKYFFTIFRFSSKEERTPSRKNNLRKNTIIERFFLLLCHKNTHIYTQNTHKNITHTHLSGQFFAFLCQHTMPLRLSPFLSRTHTHTHTLGNYQHHIQ